jgi:Fe-S cluster assembly protein SufD
LASVPPNLERAIAGLDGSLLTAPRRSELLARAFELRSGREKPNRFWKIDLDALDYSAIDVSAAPAPKLQAPSTRGLIVCDLQTAVRDHADLVRRAFGSACDVSASKFAALSAALCNTGAFVYVAADAAPAEPIEITYDAAAALFPYTLVVLERGANCTIVERVRGSAPFVGGISEIVTGEGSAVTYCAVQDLATPSRAVFTRAAKPAKDAAAVLCVAELGAALSVETIEIVTEHPGVDAQINILFFPRSDEHVDVVSTVHHAAGDSQSHTLVKSAATGRGQARYLGNIRIAPHAQATEAALRDDALLLSKRSHIDSVPALEIAANDVKAYHGATVGALDEDQIFYMTSRGIERSDAEKMIALGFFEPVVERFSTKALREEIRAALQAKVSE